jgi:hypothetical protein
MRHHATHNIMRASALASENCVWDVPSSSVLVLWILPKEEEERADKNLVKVINQIIQEHLQYLYE